MTESQLLALVTQHLVRVVLQDRTFHVITTNSQFCSPQQATAVAIGHVRCWCLVTCKWIVIDPAAVFAHELIATEPAAALD